ncbi:hypothetical protein O7602_28135 [Micromonospora sp. WMMD1128]|uniref:hypothetical protein n=1 Tax=Micromonospora sp. WMMD1128 TaxID=3015150 RepID=UPI00248B868B|nr:hypothetical protein [Micromonospora sp. WMMD1128]WBB73493.1 hypothetical protein O7602_28135 [Micromonospora sp. WMMD1128]
MTSEIYGHLMPESNEEAAAALGGMRSKPAKGVIDDVDEEDLARRSKSKTSGFAPRPGPPQ